MTRLRPFWTEMYISVVTSVVTSCDRPIFTLWEFTGERQINAYRWLSSTIHIQEIRHAIPLTMVPGNTPLMELLVWARLRILVK